MQAYPLTESTQAHFVPQAGANVGAQLLPSSAREEALSFLQIRPLHTAYLSGIIRENGLVNDLNRGSFYGYRNSLGQLEGVALIGHATLMETTSDEAIQAFAHAAQDVESLHMIMCEENRLEKFWSNYSRADQRVRRASRQHLYELRWPVEVSTQACKLRLATSNDLEQLIPVHAEMAYRESGIDPREKDADGFAGRYARRIAQGRTWVVFDGSELIFKADVITQSPDNAYIEGVWVNSDLRRRGYGSSCMSQLARMLRWSSKSLCLFVNDENDEAQNFFKQSGYHARTVYDTIFL